MKMIGSLLNTLVGVAVIGVGGFLCYKMVVAWKKDSGPAFVHSYDEARKKAIQENKPMVLVFSASWCPPCRHMKKNVYPSPEVKPYHEKFVWAYLDADDRANAAAAQQFGVHGIPHIVAVKANGTRLFTQVGGSQPAALAEQLRAAWARN